MVRRDANNAPLLLLLLVVVLACLSRTAAFGTAFGRVRVHSFRGLPALRSSSTSRTPATAVDSVALTTNALAAFDAATNNPLTRAAIASWETTINASARDLRSVTDSKVLQAVYLQLLKKASSQPLDRLQLATFDLLGSAFVDGLLAAFPKGVAVTPLVDELTDLHLNYLETFATFIGDSGGEDGYSESENQQYLCYQLAGMTERVYAHISRGLGPGFESSPAIVSLRTSSWVSPIYARLQRRFTRFLSGEVEERMEAINGDSFDSMLSKLPLEIIPRYSLHLEGLAGAFATAADADATAALEAAALEMLSDARAGALGEEDEVLEAAKEPAYPSRDLASFVSKVLRTTIAGVDPASIEPKVARLLQSQLSVRMRALGRPLEQISSRIRKGAQFPRDLTSKDLSQIEDMLEIGHVSAAAVYLVWQIRYNLVGVPEDPVAGYEGNVLKEYLSLPALLPNANANSLLNLMEQEDEAEAEKAGANTKAKEKVKARPKTVTSITRAALAAAPKALRRQAESAVSESAGIYLPFAFADAGADDDDADVDGADVNVKAGEEEEDEKENDPDFVVGIKPAAAMSGSFVPPRGVTASSQDWQAASATNVNSDSNSKLSKPPAPKGSAFKTNPRTNTNTNLLDAESVESLVMAASLAHAVRTTAAEEFRALITYNSDPAEWPASRDNAFVSVFTAVQLSYLTNRHSSLSALPTLCEGLVAMAALEETIGVREPRAACMAAYESALRSAALTLTLTSEVEPDPIEVALLSGRVGVLEAALGMAARLPEGMGAKVRLAAFRGAIDALLADSGAAVKDSVSININTANGPDASMDATATATAASAGLRRIYALYPSLARALGVDPQAASSIVEPLGLVLFDKAVGQVLLNQDYLQEQGGPGQRAALGGALLQRLLALGRGLLLPEAEIGQRVAYLSGAVLEGYLERALEDYRRMSIERSEMVLLRASALPSHPLVEANTIALMAASSATANANANTNTNPNANANANANTNTNANANGKDIDIGETAARMALIRLGAARLSEVTRMIEVLRARVDPNANANGSGSGSGSGSGQDWGSGALGGGGGAKAKGDERYVSFLASLQERLLREFSRYSLAQAQGQGQGQGGGPSRGSGGGQLWG